MNISFAWVALIVSLLLMSAFALADKGAKADIHASGADYRGVMMVNQAAGTGQQQANAGAISTGDMPAARIDVLQSRGPLAPDATAMDASSHIHGGSFSNGAGVLGVNQSAGAGNQHINAFRLEIGSMPQSLDDGLLAQSAAPSSVNSGAEVPQGGERQVEMDDQAFSGSAGVVQLNQSAGVGNRTVNNVGIRILK